jgi:hypothetical protein
MIDQPDKHHIRQMLIQLHEQLAQAQAEGIDEEDQALLHHLMGDIQEMLARAEQGSPAHALPSTTIADRMESAVTRLEVTHPTLTSMLQKAMDTLSIAGI